MRHDRCPLCNRGLPVVFYAGWPYHEDPEAYFRGKRIYWDCHLSVEAARTKESQQARNALTRGLP